MRVSFASIKAAIAAMTLAALVGCAMPSWHGMGSKNKSDAAALASAPPAPSFNPAAPQPATVTMPPAGQTASNMPLYPGTNYPVTPYPATATPTGTPAMPAAYTASAPAAASPYTAAPAAQAAPPSTYTQTQAAPYAPPATGAATYSAASPSSVYTR